MPRRFAELQGGIEQSRYVENHLITLHGETRHTCRGDQRGRHMNLAASAGRHPGMKPDIVEGAVERAPAKLGGTRDGRIQVRLIARQTRCAQQGLDILHHVIWIDSEGHFRGQFGVFHVSSMGHAGWKSRVSSAP